MSRNQTKTDIQMPYQPIQCHIHDFIEIACMRHYTLDVELLTGEILRGIAETTRSFEQIEYLVLSNEKQQQEVPLDKIRKFTTIDKEAEFNTITVNGMG